MKHIILITLITVFPLISCSQSDKEKVENTVKQSQIEGHIYFLASDELKGRETGKPEANIAASYLANTLRGYGVKPVPGAENSYYQKIKFLDSKPPSTVTISLDEYQYDDALVIKGNNFTGTGEVVFVGFGLEEDYSKSTDYKGKIILAKAGQSEEVNEDNLFKLSQEKRQLAKKYKAKALIEYNSYSKKFWDGAKRYFGGETLTVYSEAESEASMPHIWVNSKNKIDLKSIDVSEINIAGASQNIVISSNVVGMLEGTDPKLKDEFIIYSAHYDHVGLGAPNAEGDSIYNGARDNAVGTVTVLTAAENIAKYPTKRSALFILFTGEEKGLLGSKYYVENPLIPLSQMVYCFNSDNASYNDTSKATIVGLNRTTAEEHIKNAASEFGITAINDPAPEQNLFDRSDNVHFAKQGIPAPTYSLGFTAFDSEVFKYYHKPSDNPDNLDYEYLLKFFKSYALACRYIANADETPFWVEGDKYYEAGINLYKR